MDVIAWIAAGLVGWILLMLAAGRFCAMNTISEEHDQRIIEESVRELRDDMRAW